MLDGLDLDPHDILELARGCSAEELRDAYHKKSKKHHPDGGGDEWAFRVIVWAHEAVSQTLGRERFAAQTREVPDTGRIRAGVHDKGVDPARLVHVEMVWMRYEVDDVLGLLADKTQGEGRNLSGSLNITWPGEDVADDASVRALTQRVLPALNAAFDDLRARTTPIGARSRIEEGGFFAELGYPSGQAAWEAFKHFHVGLKARGLGVKQWTRDVMIPREAKG